MYERKIVKIPEKRKTVDCYVNQVIEEAECLRKRVKEGIDSQ